MTWEHRLQIADAAIFVALVIVLRFVPARACCGRYLAEPRWKRGLHLREWHHGFLVLLGLVPWVPLQVGAIAIGLDDLLGQHVWHLVYRFAGWRSPLHHLAAATWYRWRQA